MHRVEHVCVNKIENCCCFDQDVIICCGVFCFVFCRSLQAERASSYPWLIYLPQSLIQCPAISPRIHLHRHPLISWLWISNYRPRPVGLVWRFSPRHWHGVRHRLQLDRCGAHVRVDWRHAVGIHNVYYFGIFSMKSRGLIFLFINFVCELCITWSRPARMLLFFPTRRRLKPSLYWSQWCVKVYDVSMVCSRSDVSLCWYRFNSVIMLYVVWTLKH